MRYVRNKGGVGDDEAGDDGGESRMEAAVSGGLVRSDVERLRTGAGDTDEDEEADERGKPEEAFKVVEYADAAKRDDERDARCHHNATSGVSVEVPSLETRPPTASVLRRSN